MSTELDEVKALISAEGAANAKRFEETGEQLGRLMTAMQHATNVQQEHGKRIEGLERAREEDQQRLTRTESSAAVLGERLGQLGEQQRATQSAVDAQGKAAAANAQEMQTQTQTLKEIREGQVARDAKLDQHLGLLESLKEDKIRREEREKVEREGSAKEAARLERIDKRRSYWIALAGLALAVLSALSGWLVYRDQVRAQQSPPAIVAPAH